MSKVIQKQFTSTKDATSEREGYDFLSQYYSNIPKYMGQTGSRLMYENKSNDKITSVAEALYAGKQPSMSRVFAQYIKVSKKEAKTRRSEGGTKIFYINRLHRLTDELEENYMEWCKANNSIQFFNIIHSTNHSLITSIRKHCKDFEYGVCVPSQGDFHERNVLTDDTVIDFEGSGWNLIATDIATLLWHTIFAGQYFGLRYAKWASKETEKHLLQQALPSIDESVLSYSLSSARKAILSEYLEVFPSYLDEAGVDEESIKNAIIYRLFTTFEPMDMSEEDRRLTFAFATIMSSRRPLKDIISVFILEEGYCNG